MKDQRALHYYERLLPLGTKCDVFISLSEVAEKLCTTTRHSRTLLQELQQRQWLTWQPKVGRNQRSVIHLAFERAEIRQVLARVQIEAGYYENAMTFLEDDQQQFAALLRQTSGAIVREDQLHIQLTYQRVFDELLPHTPLRNSERFLVRQVYACLTGCDKEGQLTPQLSHAWTSNEDATIWRFYIRPQLKFHSGEVITAALIKELFEQLHGLPEYREELSHVVTISFTKQSVTFELSSPDLGFAALLSDLRYSIQPPKQISSPIVATIDGSGAFQVVEQSDERLRLQANDFYFGLRSLTDTVTIWQLANTPSERIQLGHYDQPNLLDRPDYLIENRSDVQESTQTRIENGCLYMLFNTASQQQLTLAQRRWLASVLSPETILQHDQLSELLMASIPAHNFLPSWTQIKPCQPEPASLPSCLDIAVYDHLVIKDCAQVMKHTLNQMGIDCTINVYSLEEMHKLSQHRQLSEPLVIASFNVDDNLPISVYRWLMSDSILHQGLSDDASAWLRAEMISLRESSQVTQYLAKLESIATTMHYQNWLTPLFHHRQTLRWKGVLQGVSITDWSWPDFRNVWIEDELEQ
ncbi:SgrR family transcriptional regulator [Vibrio mediterranei]|uniref:SgrR family transcriptional regulator n=1 Tax=Vibrio mediterranei TaxID=689 RepID=UPI00148D5DE6|nr:SgrR family transcriptional regulator [Vibrio mediterranei]NOH31152.1 peptide-binding protein [Vibrio mediterranei]